MRMLWRAGLTIAGAAAVILAVWASGAQAHSWYTGLLNEKGEACCHDQDCGALPDGAVQEVPGGYQVDYEGPLGRRGPTVIHAFVPDARAKPAREDDGYYHVCFWGGQVRCFFYPNRGY